jgi:anaerobic selenocysteine-containing dehydrogenase
MFNYVRLSDGGIRRLDNVRPETFILAELGRRLVPDRGIDFLAFKRHRRIREAISEIVPGMEALADIDVARREFHVGRRILHEPHFLTPSGRAQFRQRVTPAPRSVHAPFMLTTLRSEGQFNSIIYEEKDAYRRTDTRWALMMNADDMSALGLSPGACADIRSAQGEMKGVTLFAFDLPRGDVAAYFPEANVLTAAAVDPRSKTPAFKATPVWIAPAASAASS